MINAIFECNQSKSDLFTCEVNKQFTCEDIMLFARKFTWYFIIVFITI